MNYNMIYLRGDFMNNYFINRIAINHELIEDDSYLNKIPTINNLDTLIFDNPITFFVGENGTGKSTLLEAIAINYGFNPEGGTLNFNFHTNDTHSSLYKSITLDRGYRRPKEGFFLRAESFYNVATQLDKYENEAPDPYHNYGGKSLHQQSHGESFLTLIQNRFNQNSLYILDEPEASLSPQRQLTLLISIYELAKKGSQFIIASHSPILLGIPNAKILTFDHHQITSIAYEDTESYQITELFINNRERLFNKLLNE